MKQYYKEGEQLENYTKYKLKSNDELVSVLTGKDNLFIVACNKCFKEFETVDEPDCGEFEKIAAENGKTITGSVKVDFLCNKTQTEKKLQDVIPEGTENVFVISCGLGIQTVADLAGKPVFAASNSLNYRGHHGMALTKKSCDACAQCYLNITGGVCPIVDCSKSLVNGQCGGAKDGKCEVDGNKDCAWEKIYRRLEKQGRLEEFLNQPVQVRDYSKVNVKFVSEYVKSIRENRLEGYYGGVHPSERKEFTEHLALEKFPDPEVVVIPLSMHAGAPANPVVQVGDTVKVGQKIGEAAAFISSPIHSSVSGTVIAIEPHGHATRGECMSVVIRSDGKNTLHESVQPHKDLDSLTPDEIVEIVREAGIVGMGGAGFPTSVKLKPAKPVDTILLNGCECEPLLTADHRVLLEYADDVIFGLKAMIKTVGAEKGLIVIEDNKPDAIELMQAKTADIGNIDVVVAKTKYPQGAEKMLIKRVMKRQVPSGGLPADVGCVVSNISTTKAIADAIQKGMPLIERVVTVTGENLKKPGNYIVKIGTNTKDLLDYCGGVTGDDVTIKAGGPMMGFVLSDVNVPIMKGSNGIIAVDTDHTVEQPCIKCGRCVDVCPMELSPLYFAKYADEQKWLEMKDKNVMDCVECRCCEYICSSKIPLVTKIKAGKNAIRGMK
ncbi:electron transport complex subunit RsxC [Ruminococcus sp. 5_1_39BFAA]|uniref:electron transport complex subunit RsxC n=1 Tax=Ruminococcus sp. 5_1_39BFAA TaxID=457412 RepID=UPI00356949AE